MPPMLDGQRQVVVATEPGRRRIVVGPRGTEPGRCMLRDVNWLMPLPASDLRCTVKLRAREEPRPASSVQIGGDAIRDAWTSRRCPHPGRPVSFTLEDRVLGGGIIARVAGILAVACRAGWSTDRDADAAVASDGTLDRLIGAGANPTGQTAGRPLPTGRSRRWRKVRAPREHGAG